MTVSDDNNNDIVTNAVQIDAGNKYGRKTRQFLFLSKLMNHSFSYLAQNGRFHQYNHLPP